MTTSEADLAAFAFIVASESLNQELESYQQPMSCDDKEKWQKTIEDEIESLQKNKTWVLVEKPKNKKFVDCKWIQKKKNVIPRVEKTWHNARLVARGLTQK